MTGLCFIWVFYASCDQVCRWPMAGQWYYLGTLYNIMWSSDRRQVSGILYETFCSLSLCQWYSLGNLYNIMWSSLSVTCGRSMVFSSLSVTCDRSVIWSIQHYVMKFVSDLWWYSLGSLYNIMWWSLSVTMAGQWYSLVVYNIMWWSLSVTCGRSVIFSR